MMTSGNARWHDDVAILLSDALADPEAAWSMGSFGAIAEFMRDADEAFDPLDDGRLGLSTERGAVALEPAPDMRPFAYETAFGSGWNHAVALCLPETACAMAGRRVITELGPDRQAARAVDREAILFDLGLGLRAVDACVRASNPAVLACLRAGLGKPLFSPDNPVGPELVSMSPQRVFVTRIGRVEVYAAIPAPGGTSPAGPHTHVLPQFLKAGRTHAATTPIPAGFVPCGALHPPHPYKDALGRRIPFERARFDAFQRLLNAWGDPELVAVKRAVEAGQALPDVSQCRPRFVEGARRAALIQTEFLRGEATDSDPVNEHDEERGHV